MNIQNSVAVRGLSQFYTRSGSWIRFFNFWIRILIESDLISEISRFFVVVIFTYFKADTRILLEVHILLIYEIKFS